MNPERFLRVAIRRPSKCASTEFNYWFPTDSATELNYVSMSLNRYFGTSPGFRLRLDYELMRAERESGERISREVQPHAA